MLARVVKEWPLALCAALSLGVALAYLIVTHDYADSLGFPLDDAYIYLTYAKQIGRFEPMTYYPGGPYSAGATSPLWPFVLAPFWMIGFRGYALVYAAFAVSAVLVAVTTALAFHVVERISGRAAATIAAAGTALSGSFTFGSLSAMEVGLAAAMVLLVVAVLMREGDRASPSPLLLVLLAASSVTRPELTLLVAGFVVLRAALAALKRRPRVAGWWLTPILLPLAWVTANKLVAGNFFPNTGVAKSHFYAPGFTLEYYFDLLPRLFKSLFRGLFWSAKGPLFSGKLTALFALLGIVHLGVWARRSGQGWAALVLASAPIALLFAVIAASGMWSFHNYRYISASFPWLACLVALGVALPFALVGQAGRWKWPSRLAPLAFAVVVVVFSAPLLWDDIRLFGQGVRDTNDHVVKIGRFINRELPADAHIAFHDAGAISYYGDRRGTDILGLVTNGNARHGNEGAGTRFERLENIPVADRPTHFAYYRNWLGTSVFFGEVLLQTPLRATAFRGKSRLIGGSNMEVIVAKWDAVGSGHVPCTAHEGWTVVDRIDVADIENEEAHEYSNDLGPRRFGFPTARWSDARTARCGDLSSITDGGRVHRGKRPERFVASVAPGQPARLIVRTGGTDTSVSKTPEEGVRVRVAIDGRAVGEVVVHGRSGDLFEASLDIGAEFLTRPRVEVSLDAGGVPYRSFQFFVLQRVAP